MMASFLAWWRHELERDPRLAPRPEAEPPERAEPRKSSIRRKLILLLTSTASTAVIVACALLWAYQLMHARNLLRVEINAAAGLIAESSAPALLFNDAKAAGETLTDLRADTRVDMACLYDRSGHVLARFAPARDAGSCPAPQAPGLQFARQHLTIFRPVTTLGQPAGSLYLEMGLAELYASLLHFAETALLAVLLATCFALALASVLERIISSPILHLTEVATSVSENGNTLLRARDHRRHGASDEIGVLIEQFNLMMDRIQQREEELRDAQAGLEDTVRLRTLDLRNEITERKVVERDLERSREAAEEASRAKSAFLANMSHELRTPLNAIIGYSEMLYEDAQDSGEETMLADLQKILLSARHLLTLISDILDLSKIEAGQMRVSPEPVLVNTMLEEVLASAGVLARRNGNRLVVEEPVWEGFLFVDPLRFRQCLLNLLSNACKFTENGTVTVAVLRVVNQAGVDEVLWSVSDTGIGIPPEDQEKLFGTFTQVDGSATRRFGGSGLGLAISKQLCESMGGGITVESELGKGSTFTIHMPPYQPGQEDKAHPQETLPGAMARMVTVPVSRKPLMPAVAERSPGEHRGDSAQVRF